MAEKVEHGSALDDPRHCDSDGLEQMLKLPAAVAERTDVADWAHWDIEQACGIKEGLSFELGCNDIGVSCVGRSSFFCGDKIFHAGVDRVFATDPIEAEAEEHFLQIFAAVESGCETAGRAKTIRFNSEPIFQCYIR